MRKMDNKEEEKVGDRIKLVHTDDKFVQLKPGSWHSLGHLHF
jgi:hypothetical protein